MVDTLIPRQLYSNLVVTYSQVRLFGNYRIVQQIRQ